MGNRGRRKALPPQGISPNCAYPTPNRARISYPRVRVNMYEGTKHTSSTEALRGGRRMGEIQKALGHRDRRSTERYAKLAEVTPVDDIFRRRKG